MEVEEPLSIHSFLESMKIRKNPKTTTSFSINPIQTSVFGMMMFIILQSIMAFVNLNNLFLGFPA